MGTLFTTPSSRPAAYSYGRVRSWFRRAFLVGGLSLLCSPLSSLSFDGYEIGFGVAWLSNIIDEGIQRGDRDANRLLFIPEVRFHLALEIKNLFLAPGLSLWGCHYRYIFRAQRPMPGEYSMGRALFVATPVISLPLLYQYRVGSWSFGALAGLSFFLYLPLWGEAPQEDREAMFSAFYGTGGFLFLLAGAQVSVESSTHIRILARLYTHMPLSNLWRGLRSISTYDTGLVVGSIAVQFHPSRTSSSESLLSVE